jgi:CcmD family protein
MNDSLVVLGAILIVWLGIFGYLVALDRRVRRVDRKVGNDEA